MMKKLAWLRTGEGGKEKGNNFIILTHSYQTIFQQCSAANACSDNLLIEKNTFKYKLFCLCLCFWHCQHVTLFC